MSCIEYFCFTQWVYSFVKRTKMEILSCIGNFDIFHHYVWWNKCNSILHTKRTKGDFDMSIHTYFSNWNQHLPTIPPPPLIVSIFSVTKDKSTVYYTMRKSKSREHSLHEPSLNFRIVLRTLLLYTFGYFLRNFSNIIKWKKCLLKEEDSTRKVCWASLQACEQKSFLLGVSPKPSSLSFAKSRVNKFAGPVWAPHFQLPFWQQQAYLWLLHE